jgi:hypothetical protein
MDDASPGMTPLEFEWAEADPPQLCACCGGRTRRLTRFVCRDGGAYAVVYIAYTDTHADRLVKFAVSLGDWHGEPAARRCFIVWYKDLPDAYGFMLCDPGDGDWEDVALLGRQLTRAEALVDPWVGAVWEILDRIVIEDPVLHPYLCGPSQGGTSRADPEVR